MQLPISISPQWARRARWALCGLLGVWVLAWLTVPPLAKRLIEEKGSAVLGRPLSVGDVAFRPWSLELTVTDIAVATADGKGTQLQVDRVELDAELESLLRMAPVLDSVAVDAPRLHLRHLGDGHYDVDDILQRVLKTPQPSQPAPPLQFALYNLTLHGGAVDFTDQLAGGERRHTVRGLDLAVPFLSTLPSKRDVKVLPRLAFELNGSRFDSAAEGTPFAQHHKGEAVVKIVRLDLAPYLPYLPASLPVRLHGAVVDADLRLAFDVAAQPTVTLSGSVGVAQMALGDAAGKPLLAVESVAAELADVRPLDRVATLASLTVTKPRLQASRNRAGRFNLEPDAFQSAENAIKIEANKQQSTRASGKNSSQSLGATRPWSLTLERFSLHGGEVTWTDERTQPKALLGAQQVELQARALHWPLGEAAATFEASASLPSRGKTAQLALTGRGSASRATVHANLVDGDLNLAAPYLAQFLEPTVAGVLEGEFDATWQAAPADQPDGAQLTLAVPRLGVRDFALKGLREEGADATRAERAAADLPRVQLLEVTDAQLDLVGRTGRVGRVLLRAPSAMAHRDAQGQWMVQRWLKAPAIALADPASEAGAAPAKPWQVSLGELRVADGHFRLDDRALARPARLDVSALQLQLKAATLAGSQPAPLSVSARLKSGRTEPGSLKYHGTVMWAPLALQGSVDAVDVPLHGVAPYVADQLNLTLLRADASYRGQVGFTATAGGPELHLQGDAALKDVRAQTVAATVPEGEGADLEVAEELLSWKALHVPGIALDMAPASATRVQVREATLSDFFARVIIDTAGRLNLQDLVKTRPAAAPSAAEPQAVVRMGPVRLLNGKVLFSDRFIRPNYSADLSELNGTLSPFASVAPDGSVQLADLDLRGRAEGSATLEVTGKVNPLAKPLALDIRGRVRDLDLSPLTAYSIKYAGYGIERGKLGMDVHYTVQSDGQLNATNKLVLNQLTFGDKVDGAPNSLPVKLAVALLADRNGVIDLDLPISGSLNDPQFSIGAVVWKVITNLIGKAITAPFALLAHAWGGGEAGEELHSVAFAPGSAVLTPDAAQGLDRVAQVLVDKPSLRLTVVGTASLETERDALKRERLKGLMLAEKRRRAVVRDQDAAMTNTLLESEYPALLKEVYRRADIAKPRNLVGLAKDIPYSEMEALLLTSITVHEEGARALALQRGVAVKDYLASRKLPGERLFLGAIRVATPDAGWKPRAELELSSR